ncbi:tRNA lysidine(34) synthetase [Paracidovorax cattleyae]|uniref:tRNA(Ile)-lysidine synthase n=1 Tax=Paracidovorax cattleyae TaxID=80868 RepID=A0A1H0R6P5_9BURK|nr:tRNA lysidine(34) synthetase TilS [Paracidovorax cattleyae]AVS74754.1 tRNA(Ile)-lysidine synthetase [Paracidovorax cattleyae]MBF9266093.1 tRNA lysidine(34) synthetase TilS [Paracidovorax cattleyae]SDP24658.1 tRNA(Ile)-lysidine synthase [Paracidovorax cattleyae]
MTRAFDAAMDRFRPALPLGVALSGGADSTALLHACAQRWPGQVHALHVHHGLQVAADGFEEHCRALCGRLGVPLRIARVDARHASGESPEDAARQRRYDALRGLAGGLQGTHPTHQAGADGVMPATEAGQGGPSGEDGRDGPAVARPALAAIALAQHADDQVETVLLALSRGAGVAGLAAMPVFWRRGGIDWHRPLLEVAGAEVRAWLSARGGSWVEDPTNTDERYTRNRIRARLLPVLQAAFPQFRDTFARSASHAAEAAVLLRELAQADLQAIGQPPRIAALRALGRERQANALRHWLRTVHATTPTAAQLGELLDQIAACATRGHRIRIRVGRGFVVRQGGELGWYN